jgi:hypothetical protein
LSVTDAVPLTTRPHLTRHVHRSATPCLGYSNITILTT